MHTFLSTIHRKTILLGVFLLVSSLLVASSKEDTTDTKKAPSPNALGKICFAAYLRDNRFLDEPSPMYVYIEDATTGKDKFIDSVYVRSIDNRFWHCSDISEADIQTKQAVCVLAEVGSEVTWDLRGYCDTHNRGEDAMWKIGDVTTIDNSVCNFVNGPTPCFAPSEKPVKKMSMPSKKNKK